MFLLRQPGLANMFVMYMVHLICTIFPCTPLLLTSGNEVRPENSEVNQLFGPEKPAFSDSFPYEPISSNAIVKELGREFPVVWTHDGGLRGFRMETLSGRGFSAFQGLPFAKPPVGPLRFKAPVKNDPWSGIRDAIVPSPTCLQIDFIKAYNVSGTEDCLYLNVYTPKVPGPNEKPNLAVMVFIHGGGFFFGSSNLYGPTYMMDEKVVLVSMNYRLGPFGFLSTGDMASPGNNGLKDQALALKWVNENIEAFGGDPNRVTIFGESAGAGSVQFHMISPLSKGLFHGGISESGCTFCFWSISERAKAVGKEFASTYSCDSDNSTEMIECLRGVDGGALAQGQLKFLEWVMYPVVVFGPVIEPQHEGAFLNDLPGNVYQRGEAAAVPWITGFNADEGALNIASIVLQDQAVQQINEDWDRLGPVFLDLKDSTQEPTRVARSVRDFYLGDKNVSFSTRHEAVKMFSDRYVVVCGVKSINYHAQLSGKPVYAYHFNYRGSYGMVQLVGQKTEDWGVAHLDELIYLMNNTAYYPTLKKTDEEYQVSRIFVNLWTNFAKTGKPFLTNADGSQDHLWDAVNPNNSGIEYLAINLDPHMVADPFGERVEFWRSLGLTEGEDDLSSHSLLKRPTSS